MADKLLTISLLMSGREDTTQKCLDSLKKLQEQVDTELILVDTGCDEAMKQVLAQYTDQIVPFPWCDDFAKARNAGLQRAKGKWFLFLDDDEWFEDVTPIVEFFQSGEYQEYDQAVYKARNYSNLEGTDYTDEWVSRIIKLEEDTHFEGRVHESIVPAKGRCKKLEAFVHHYGYAFPDEAARVAHKERNVTLLEKLIAEEPNNMRWRIQLLQEYAVPQDAKLLREAGLSAVALVQEVDKPFVNQCRGAFYTAVLMADLWMADANAMEEDCRRFLADERNPMAARCGICFYAVKSLEKACSADEKEKLADYAQEYLCCYELHQAQEKDEQEQIIEESILFVKDCVTEQEQQYVKRQWAAALADLNRGDEILDADREAFRCELERMMDGNGEFLLFPEVYWKLGKAGVIPLEDLLLQLPFSQWMAVVMVLESRKSPELWKRLQENLRAIRTRDDLRYDYFDVHMVNTRVTQDADGRDYTQMCALFKEFAECSLRYAHQIYKDAAFEGNMEMLEDSCRAAVWIQRMLDCDDHDWNRKLEYLGKSAKAWVALGETVKRFAVLLGEEQERQAEQAKAATDEMYAMAEQVKQQVAVLMEAGMNAEALGIVRQLSQMLPEDQELMKLKRELELKFS